MKEAFWNNKRWMVEVSPKKWKTKSRYLIETALNRPLEYREKVFFKNNNPQDCFLDNLYVIDFNRKIKFYLLQNGTIVVQSMKVWSRYADFCVNCTSDANPHHGLGLCEKCYFIKYHQPSIF